MKITLGITGSIAANKTYSLIEILQSQGHEIYVVSTKNSELFFDVEKMKKLVNGNPPSIKDIINASYSYK